MSVSHDLNVNPRETGAFHLGATLNWPGLGDAAGGGPEGVEEIRAQLLPCTNKVGLRISHQLQPTLCPTLTSEQDGNPSPKDIGKGILGNAVLVAKLTQYITTTVAKVRNTRQMLIKVSAELWRHH